MENRLQRGLAIGIQLPEVERVVQWSEYLDMARFADGSNFDSIWIGDHLLYRNDGRPERGPHEAWTMLAALAAVTERVALGPLVACTGFHPPAVLAKMAATVGEISSGRFVLGLGAGWNEAEFSAFDIPFDHRASRFEESLAIIGELVSGRRSSRNGTFHTVQDAILLPAPDHRIPIMIGSNGERVLRSGLAIADSWNTWFDWFGNDPDGFARANDRISALVKDIGRDPRTVGRSACLLVCVDPSNRERPDPDGGRPVALGDLRNVLQEMEQAGANEVIIVADPITERSMRAIDAELSDRVSMRRHAGR